ncbi:hybrid sensor histidine kinase/response regulator [Crocosphaera chwakensis]|uniref:histidine kinase n=1 Tax=Crocosphaera chwakensis CCY0110 TaxID=391612 RepID=A3IYC4_9CHRO|nr:hybrid sensor histidine kinase/response regulator [Crocosphaera chwakensis]EAZ88532.1 CheA signal transduction histidine kinases [Crocosphaera chwakensis CCY0110]
MYIEDDELRDIYKTVTPERLQKLEDALIFLEKQPNDQSRLEEFLREAHTLKGDSRMLGVEDVETLTHQMEDCLVAVKEGKNVITPDLCDRLYGGLDAVRKLVHEAVTGESAGVVVFQVLANLMGAETNGNGNSNGNGSDSSASPVPSEEDLLFADDADPIATAFDEDLLFEDEPLTPEVTQKTATINHPVAEQLTTTNQPTDSSNIDTIRIESKQLDGLMRQAGELNVTKLRIGQRMLDIEAIMTLWEEWSRDTSAHHSAYKQMEQGVFNGNVQQIQALHYRAKQRLEQLGTLISHLKRTAYEDTTQLDTLANDLQSGIQTLRLLPLSTMFNVFPRMVRDLAKQQGKQINLVIEGGDIKADKRILEEMKDPLLHILRNAIDHGIETPQEREKLGKSPTATLRLRGYQTSGSIGIEVLDDGRGLNLENIKRTALRRGICQEEELAKMTAHQIQSLIFAPGFSTRTEVSEISGRGVGLDVVRANVERLKGSIQVESSPGMGCEFRIQLSTNLATTHVLITEVQQSTYGIPVESVETAMLVSRQEIFSIEGSQTITVDGQPVSVVWLADLLELPVTVPQSAHTAKTTTKNIPCILLKMGNERLGILVDALLDQQDIVLKPQSKLLKRVRNILGATILGDGQVCMVLNPQDLFKSLQKGSGKIVSSQAEEVNAKPKLLLVEDSIIIRTQMKRLLEGAGYDLTIAVDGLEGFNKLRAGKFDAVVSDVEMPNLSGLDLTAKIRQYREYNELPVILVTTLASEEDKRRGAQAGANAYLTKGDFDQKILIETLRRLI